MKKPDEETKKEPKSRSRTDEIREAWNKPEDDGDDELYNA